MVRALVLPIYLSFWTYTDWTPLVIRPKLGSFLGGASVAETSLSLLVFYSEIGTLHEQL